VKPSDARLRTDLDGTGDTPGPLESSRWLEIVIDKVRSFGGQVDGVRAAGIEAVFGIDRTEDPPRRAAPVALAIRRQFSREPAHAPPVRMAIHACRGLVVRIGDAGRVEAGSKREIAPLMDALLAAAAPGRRGEISTGRSWPRSRRPVPRVQPSRSIAWPT
jgi:hypothetical protein